MQAAIGAGGERARVVAVCDVDSQRAADTVRIVKKRYGADAAVDVYGDFRELLARDDIDGVTISTPDHQHAVIAVAAAEAKKDIYIPDLSKWRFSSQVECSNHSLRAG